MAISRLRSMTSLSKCKSTAMSLPFQISIFRRASTQVSSQFESIGFIGLGNMGSRMANNLVKAGYKVAVHDINENSMKKFSDMGVDTKKTPFEVAEDSDVVITMLPSSSHVDNVYTGPNGLIHGGNLLRPRLLIDSSTIDPQSSRRLSETVSNCISKGKKENWESPKMLDAPVSGGVLAAEAGTLTFMVGGSEEAYLAAKPLFLSMGKSTVYCGGAGNGSLTAVVEMLQNLYHEKDRYLAAKICNNLAMAISMLGVSEAFALGQSLGIPASTLTKVLNCSSARCWSSDTYNPVPGVMEGVPSSRNYDGGFASKLMAKDLNLAASAAKDVGLKCPVTFQTQKIYTELCQDGHENKDFSCVFRHYYSGKNES